MEDIKSPNPRAPLPKSSFAKTGIQTLKFIPNVATHPTSTIGSSTAGVLRT